MLLISTAALAAETLPWAAPDMVTIEYFGDAEINGATEIEILSATDDGLIPDLPEEPAYGQK